MYYLNIFFVYSILGFIYEILLAIILGNNISSGILYGPWTMIYGFGSLIILLYSKMLFRKLKLKKIIEIILFFISVTILLTILEFIGGKTIEILFNEVLWDYSKLKYSFGKYIALEVSLVWGIMSLLLIYVIHPKLKKYIKKIPKYVTKTILTIFCIDVIIKGFSL